MNTKSKIVLAVFVGAALGVLATPFTAVAQEVPDALAVEWQGTKPCETLFEDAQIRIARCTFPPGAVHLCHSHPSYLSYTLSGGQAQVQDEKGIRKVDVVAGASKDFSAIPWHEFVNVGDTKIQYLIVERKYQPAPIVKQAACPRGKWWQSK
jgi:quercetin dioxygenase-like cupin family protein